MRNNANFDLNATPVATPKENTLTESMYLIVLYGAGTKSRTRDLLITNQLLYQLSYAGAVFLSGPPGDGGRIIRFSARPGKGRSQRSPTAIAGMLPDHAATLFPRRIFR